MIKAKKVKAQKQGLHVRSYLFGVTTLPNGTHSDI